MSVQQKSHEQLRYFLYEMPHRDLRVNTIFARLSPFREFGPYHEFASLVAVQAQMPFEEFKQVPAAVRQTIDGVADELSLVFSGAKPIQDLPKLQVNMRRALAYKLHHHPTKLRRDNRAFEAECLLTFDFLVGKSSLLEAQRDSIGLRDKDGIPSALFKQFLDFNLNGQRGFAPELVPMPARLSSPARMSLAVGAEITRPLEAPPHPLPSAVEDAGVSADAKFFPTALRKILCGEYYPGLGNKRIFETTKALAEAIKQLSGSGQRHAGYRPNFSNPSLQTITTRLSTTWGGGQKLDQKFFNKIMAATEERLAEFPTVLTSVKEKIAEAQKNAKPAVDFSTRRSRANVLATSMLPLSVTEKSSSRNGDAGEDVIHDKVANAFIARSVVSSYLWTENYFLAGKTLFFGKVALADAFVRDAWGLKRPPNSELARIHERINRAIKSGAELTPEGSVYKKLARIIPVRVRQLVKPEDADRVTQNLMEGLNMVIVRQFPDLARHFSIDPSRKDDGRRPQSSEIKLGKPRLG